MSLYLYAQVAAKVRANSSPRERRAAPSRHTYVPHMFTSSMQAHTSYRERKWVYLVEERRGGGG